MEFTAQERHLQKICRVQTACKESHQLLSLKCLSASNILRNGDYKKQTVSIDLSSFNEILDFNPSDHWIVVEPRITFSNLCRFTLSHGLMPLVVPEFSSITVGGAIMGDSLREQLPSLWPGE